jgi:molybdopterin synthase sulfur carrier subunit
MVTLRLFANLRELAGTRSASFAGDSVGSVVAAAVAAYGKEFERSLDTAKVWVNGDPADAGTPVRPGDEIALIPPVSGGATVRNSQTDVTRAALLASLLVSLVVANINSTETFVFVAVGVALSWLWDIRDVLRSRGAYIDVVPVMASAAAAANGAYAWGGEGLAAGLGVGLMFTLMWAVLDRRIRTLEPVAHASLLGLAAGIGAGSLVLIHVRGEAESTLFLVVATAAALGAWAVTRYAPPSGALDPNVSGLIAAVLTGILAGIAFDTLTLPVSILASIGTGAGFIAGRTLGSMARAGAVVHTERAPGLLTMLDGPIVAAGLFWSVVVVFG